MSLVPLGVAHPFLITTMATTTTNTTEFFSAATVKATNKTAKQLKKKHINRGRSNSPSSIRKKYRDRKQNLSHSIDKGRFSDEEEISKEEFDKCDKTMKTKEKKQKNENYQITCDRRTEFVLVEYNDTKTKQKLQKFSIEVLNNIGKEFIPLCNGPAKKIEGSDVYTFAQIKNLINKRIHELETEIKEKELMRETLFNMLDKGWKGMCKAQKKEYETQMFKRFIPEEFNNISKDIRRIGKSTTKFNELLAKSMDKDGGLKVTHTISKESADMVADTVKAKIEEAEDSFFERLKKMIPSVDTVSKWTTPAACILGCLALLHWYKKEDICYKTILAIAVMLLPEMYKHAAPYIKNLVKAMRGVEHDLSVNNKEKAEVKDEESTHVPEMDFAGIVSVNNAQYLAAAIAGLVLSWAIKDGATIDNIVKSVIKLKDFDRLRSGVYDVFEFIIEVFENVINTVRGLFGADSVFFLKDGHKSLYQLYSKAEKLSKKAKDADHLTTDLIDEILSFNALLKDTEIRTDKLKPRELKILNRIKDLMKPLMDKIKKMNRGESGSRIAPLTIMLIGPSQIGKSVTSSMLLKTLLAKTLPEDRLEGFKLNPDSEIFCKSESSDYWEGLDNQFSQICDDCPSLNTVVGTRSFESDFINIKNTVPYNVNMAFEEKGHKFYRCRILLASSNCVTFDPKNLNYPEAFINRWDLVYAVGIKPDKKYCMNPNEPDFMKRLRKPNIKIDSTVEDPCPHLEFTVYDLRKAHGNNVQRERFSTKECLGLTLDFKNVVEQAVEKFNELKEEHSHLMKLHGQIIEESLSEIENVKTTDYDTAPSDSETTHETEMAKDSKKKEKKYDYNTLSLAAVQMDLYGSSILGSDEYFVNTISKGDIVPNEKSFSAMRKFQKCMLMRRNISNPKDYETYMNALSVCQFPKGNFICPLINEKPKYCLWLQDGDDEQDRISFYTGYLLSSQLDNEERRSVIMEMDSSLISIYPSLANPTYIRAVKELKMDASDIGLLQGCIAHTLASYQTRYCYMIRKSLKNFIYESFGITKEALKTLFSKEALLSGISLLMKATGLIAVGFGAYYTFFTAVKKTIGMDNFAKNSGFTDFNAALLADTNSKIKRSSHKTEHATHDIESQNHAILNKLMASRNKTKVAKLTSQMRADPTTGSMIDTFNKTNVYLVKWGEKFYGSLWVIAERVAIMPKHYVSYFRKLIENKTITKDKPLQLISWNAQKENPFLWFPDLSEANHIIDEWKGSDISVIKLPRDFAPAPNRLNYFISVDDVPDILKENRKGRLSITRSPGQQTNFEIDLHLVDDGQVKVENGFTSPFSWSYQGYTQQGDCGAIVALHHMAKKTPGRLVGMHVAGAKDKSSSLGMPIYKEDLQKVLTVLGVTYTTDRDNLIEHQTEMITNRTPHPVLRVERRIEMPKYSKIQKSPLYNVVDKPTKKPAHLSPFYNAEGIYIDPIQIAMNKQKPESVLINHALVDIIIHETYKYMIERSHTKSDVVGRIYSIEESVRGVPGDPYIKSMPQKTSAGHPRNLEAKNCGGGKKMWFSKDGDYSLTGEAWESLKEDVERMLELAHRGHRMTHLMLDFPKDETLDIEKVDGGKVRFISGAPMDHTIGARCYTLDFMKYLMTNRIHNGLGVGVNPASSYEWGLIAKRIGAGNIIEYDHSAFDGRQQPAFSIAWTKMCNLYYDDEHNVAREMLDLEIMFSQHILDDLVTYRRGTICSGGYATIMVNSLSNSVSDTYAEYMCVTGSDEIEDPRATRMLIADLLKRNPKIVVGDDIAKSVHDKYKELITPQRMAENLKKIGYVVTSPQKDGTGMDRFVTLGEVTFLKRKFKQDDDGNWYGPLNIESIINQINYVNTKHFKISDFLLSVESYLHELALHGEEEFDWRFKIIKKRLYELYNYVPEFANCKEYFEDRENNLLLINQTFEVDEFEDIFIKKNKSLRIAKKIQEEKDVFRTGSTQTTSDQCLVTNTGGCGNPDIFVCEGRTTNYAIPLNNKKNIKGTVFSGRQEEEDFLSKTRWVCESPLTPKKIFNTQMDTTTELINLKEQGNSKHIEQGTTELVISQQPGFTPDKTQTTNLTQVPINQDSIRDFFKKKVEVSTVTWSSSSPLLTVLDTIYIDQQLTSKTIWSQKLSGYLNFRGTAVLTVQINATPFMQGALYLAWKPYVNNDPDYGIYDQMHATNAVNLSQLPGHLMTISNDSIEIRLPYVGPVEYYRRDQANPWTWGALALVVYSPLKSGAADSVNVKTWLSFDDVQVKVPYYPQMNVAKITNGQTASEQEDTGNSSGTLKRINEIMNKQTQIVRDISTLCTPPTWLSEYNELNAKALGWSKPNNAQDLTRMVRNLYFFGTNADGADISQPMSLRADNKIKLMPALGPFEGDEMSIDYIKTRWSYTNTFTWTTSNISSDLLFNGEHRPSAWTQATNLATGPASSKTIYNMTPVCFLSQFFQNWRGDLEFKLVFVKTGFHSGALSITYVPGGDTSLMSYSSAAYNMRTIIDLQEAEEFCFSVPYSVPDNFTDFLTKVGHLYIHVLNPLKAPSTVSNNIEVLVYVRGASNITFQGLRADGPRAVYYTQGADIDNIGCIEDGGIGNSTEGHMESEFEALSIGEKITSLKQVMLRMEKVGLTSSVTGITQLGIKTNSTNVFGWQKSGVPAYYSQVTNPALQPTLLDTFMCCFLFQRGSTRWACYTQSNFWYSTLKMPIDWSTNSFNIYTSRWLSQTTQTSNPAPSIFASEHTTGGLITKAPFYSRWPVTMIRPTWISTQSPAGRWDTNHYIMYEAQNSWNIADNSTTFTRSVADDYQLGFFIGIPTVCFYS